MSLKLTTDVSGTFYSSVNPIPENDLQRINDIIYNELASKNIELAHRVKVSALEQRNGQTFCKIKVDLSYFPTFQGGNKETNNRDVRTFLKSIHESAQKLKTLGFGEPIFDHIDLSHNKVSGSSILSHSMIASGMFNSLTKLNLNYTKASQTLYNLALPLLKELELDGCTEMSVIEPDAGILNSTLEKITMLKNKAIVDKNYLEKLGSAFPAIKEIYVSQPNDVKFLGIKDSSTLESAKNPVVLNPCGHVLSQISARFDINRNSCSLCRTAPDKNIPYFPAQFPTSVIRKEKDKWIVELQDYGLNVPEGRIFFHPECQQIFTDKTIKEEFALDSTDVEQTKTELKKHACPECQKNGFDKPLEAMQIYPKLTPHDQFEDSMNQQTLEELSGYAEIKN